MKRSKAVCTALAALLAAGLAAACVAFWPQITAAVSDVGAVRSAIVQFGPWGAAIFALIQVLQLVVSVIPGEPVQIAGGFLYGTWGGFALLLGATVLGSGLSFFLGRTLGAPLVRRFVSKQQRARFERMMTSARSELVTVLLFLLPGFPKDALIYLGALTPVRPVRFLVLTSLARIPTLWGSAYIGSHLYSRNYTAVIVVAAAALVLLTAGILLERRLAARPERREEKKA